MNQFSKILKDINIKHGSLLLINPKTEKEVRDFISLYAKITVFTKDLALSDLLSSMQKVEVVFNNQSFISTYSIKQFDLTICYDLFDFDDIRSIIVTIGFISSYSLISFKNNSSLANRIKFLISGSRSVFQEKKSLSFRSKIVHINEIILYLIKKSYLIDKILCQTKNNKLYSYYNYLRFPNLFASRFYILYSDKSSSDLLYTLN